MAKWKQLKDGTFKRVEEKEDKWKQNKDGTFTKVTAPIKETKTTTKTTTYSNKKSSREDLERDRLVKQYSSRNPLDYMQKSDAEYELKKMGYSDDDLKRLRKEYRANDEEGLDLFRSGAFGRKDISAVEKGVLGVGGTGLHLARNLVEGAILQPLEGGADLIRYGVAGILDGVGADKTAQTWRDVAQEDDMQKLLSFSDDYFERNSVMGNDTQGFVQAIGQVFGLKGLGAILGKAGVGAKGISTAITGTNFVTSAGSGMTDAYKSGATDEEATKYGLMQGTIDAGTELLSGGLGKGTKALGLSYGVGEADDLLAKALTKNMKNQTAKNFMQGLIKSFGEGGEEALAGYLSAHAQKGTFRSEDDFDDIVKDQELGKQFMTGMLVSNVAQVGSVAKASKQGVDYVTGYTQNEQSVVDKIANDEIQKAETEKGKPLTTKEKNKIKADVETMLQRGEIDIDTIESTLGGETYKAHENLVKESEEFETLRNKKQGDMTDIEQDRLKELKAKNTEKSYSDLISESKAKLSEEVNLATQNDMFLRESYAERGRRGQQFTVSEEQMKKYSVKEKEIVQKAIDYGEMNNTRKAHEFVDLVAKLSADKGVSFDFTNNEKLKNSGFAIEGKTINGFKQGNNITINLQSKNALNTVVGHEITHVLEGTELYQELQNTVIEYAKQKGVYDSMYKDIVHLYRNQFQDNDLQKRKQLYDSEITADLVGQYIFSDVDFVRNLSMKNRNVFQKVYDEIKYMLKSVTAGSDAEKQLLKAKKIFEDVYRDTKKNTSDKTQMSIDDIDIELDRIYEEMTLEEAEALIMDIEDLIKLPSKWGLEIEETKVSKPRYKGDTKTKGKVAKLTDERIEHLFNEYGASNPSYAKAYVTSIHPRDFLSLTLSDESLEKWDNATKQGTDAEYRPLDVEKLKNERQTPFLEVDTETGRVIGHEGRHRMRALLEAGVTEVPIAVIDINTKYSKQKESSMRLSSQEFYEGYVNDNFKTEVKNLIPLNKVNSNEIYSAYGGKGDIQYSVADNKGRTLTKEQQEKFKDSKVRDENGNLLTMYHGTPNGDYTIFRDGTYFTQNKEYADVYQNQGASSLGYKKTANNPKTYEVYLDIKKPFDTRNPKERAIFENEYYGQWGMGTPLMESGLPDWMDGEDLREFLEEKGYDYDGLILDEGGVGGYGDDVKSRGYSYVVFNPNQVKNVDNAKPTDNADIRYSVSDNTKKTYKNIKHEVTDFHNDEMFAVLSYEQDGKVVGTLEYSEYDGEPSVKMVQVDEKYRRKGIGTKLLQELQRKYPNTEINMGMTTEDGTKLLENITYTVENKEVVDKFARAKELESKLAEYDETLEKFYNDEIKLQEGYAEDYNDLYDELVDLKKELRGKKRTKTFIKTDSDVQYSLSNNQEVPIENRLSGDELLDAQDLIAEIQDVSEISPNGYITLYHRTTKENANKIRSTKKMLGKEDGIFFSSQEQGENNIGYGDDVVKLKVPIEKVVLDDIFSDEASLRIPLKNRNSVLDVSQYLMEQDIKYSLTDNIDNKPLAPKKGIYAEDVALEKPIAPIKEDLVQEEMSAPLSNQVSNKEQDEFDLFMDLFDNEDSTQGNVEEVKDPFEERNIQEVGKRNVNAYMYDNPEVKPFFQEEANIMLGELQRSTKGERYYNDQLYYDTNGEQGFYGTKRDTSDAIAELLDNYNYSYADIEKGLKAIIEDNGAENIAVAKKIEFFINERLMNGYTDFQSGIEFPKNQEYINLIEGMQADESSDSLTENTTPLAPIGEKIAQTHENTSQTHENAPIEEQTESEEIKGEDLTRKNAEKIKVIQGKIESYRMTRSATSKEFDERIANKQAEYEALQRKDTKKAVNLRNQITNLESRKDALLKDLDRKIERSTNQIENIEQESRFNKRQTKQKEFRELFGLLMGDTSTWVDKKMGIQYQTNTFRRNLRDIVRDANGKQDIAKADAIYDELQGSVNRNEALKNREGNALKNKFREMKINNHESTYIQMLGEFQNNPDSKLTFDEVSDYLNKHKKKIDVEKVNKAIEEARKLYDSLYDRVNEALGEHGFKEMGYRKGYFPHFNDPKQNWLAKLLNWKVQNDEIPTDIAGLTELFEPQRTYQSFDKHRQSDKTDYNFLKGLDNYVDGALDWIYHIEDIQKHRAFETEIRYRHSSEQIQKEIDKIRENPFLSTEEADTLIQAKLREAKNPLNNFVTDLHTRTNILAGKKSSKDRNMESDFNRHAYSVMTNISSRVTANQVVGSISSALTNFIPITQSWGQVNPTSSVVGMKQTIQSYIKDDGVVDKSDFLTNRLRQNENLYKTAWDRTGEVVGGLMEVVDNFTSQTVWRSKYYENIKKGMSEQQAIQDADQFAENVIAGRSKGNQPTIFHAKNPVSKMLTSFQLEVANQYGYMFKDMPNDIGKKAIGKLTKGYVTMFVGAYFYNALTSALTGRDSAFDPIGILEDLWKDLFGDDEEEKKEPTEAIGNFAENVAQEIPFVGGILGGGRVPISSALPYDASISEAYKDVTDGDWKSVAKELSKPLYYGVMPMGGGQIKKTVEGLKMFDDDLPTSGSYTTSGNLRYPVEKNLQNVIQSALFGQYANENARYYFDHNLAPLKPKQTQEYIDLDMPIKDYWKYREGLKEQKTVADKFDYVAGLEHPLSKKNIMINNIVDRDKKVDLEGYEKYGSYEEFDFATTNAKKYNFLKKNNISYEEYNSDKKTYDWAYNNPTRVVMAKATTGDIATYKEYQEFLNNFESDKNALGKSIPNSLKNKKFAYINNLNVDYNTKMLLWKQQYPSDDRYNVEIIEYLNNRPDISYQEMVEILEELDFTVSADGTVRWN